MGVLLKLLSSIVLLENKFKKDDVYLGPAKPHVPSYNIVYEGQDEQGRPVLLVESRNYRNVPSAGTWPGYEVHTKVEKKLWKVHYEDING